jgi:hypothetical protein
MGKSAFITILLGGIVLFAGMAAATERHVPSQYATIQAAINACNDGDVVIVAPGTYTGAGNRDIDFWGKAITVKSENGPGSCIIDAEHLGRVFLLYSGEEADSIVDGFTITHGQLYCEPGEDCPISWYGGGIYCGTYDDASPTIRNCIITDNFAHFGGGIHGGSPIITNCIFTNNEALVGAAIFTYGDAQIINCTIAGNEAAPDWDGSAVELWGDSIIANSIVWGNYPNQLFEYTSGIIIYNDIQGSWPGTGNINVDPCFADPDANDFHLQSAAGRWDPNSQSWVQDDVASPCIDAGNPGCPLGDEPSDANNVRINMGAYGGTAEASKTPGGWRSIADLTNDWAVDISDLGVFVSYWLDSGECIPSDLNRNESINFDDYSIFARQWLDVPAGGASIEYEISPCQMGLSATEQLDKTRFTVTVEGRYINFEDMMHANCCATNLWLEMDVTCNLITINEYEEVEYPPCPCLCDYPVTATLGPFKSGTYTLEVYQGGFIGSTVVTIE